MAGLQLGTYYSIDCLQRAASGYFFSPAAMRGFDSRVLSEVRPVADGWLFITSERFSSESPRLYTIRKMDENGRVTTVGGFERFHSRRAAIRAMRDLAAVR